MMFLWRIGKSSCLRHSQRPLCALPTHSHLGNVSKTHINPTATSLCLEDISKERQITTSSYQHSDTKSSTGPHSSIPDPIKNLLDTALDHHVPSLGFSHAALIAAARDLGLSPSVTAILERSSSSSGSAERPPHSASSQEGHLISHFIARCDALLMVQLRERRDELAAMPLRQRIATAIRLRLEMVKPHMERWPDALATLAQPQNSAGALKQLGVMVDNIWHALGDSSTDIRWYTKRAVLAGVYVSTQVSMLTDFSPDYEDTWALLDKRLDDLSALSKQASDLMPNPMADLSIIMQAMQASASGLSGGGSSSRSARATHTETTSSSSSNSSSSHASTGSESSSIGSEAGHVQQESSTGAGGSSVHIGGAGVVHGGLPGAPGDPLSGL